MQIKTMGDYPARITGKIHNPGKNKSIKFSNNDKSIQDQHYHVDK
jgi:hypothetical protein